MSFFDSLESTLKAIHLGRWRWSTMSFLVVALTLGAHAQPQDEAGEVVVRLPSGQTLDRVEWKTSQLRVRPVGRYLADLFVGNQHGSVDELWVMELETIPTDQSPGSLRPALPEIEGVDVLSNLAGSFLVVKSSARKLRQAMPIPGVTDVALLRWESKLSPHVQSIVDGLGVGNGAEVLARGPDTEGNGTEGLIFETSAEPRVSLEVWLFRSEDRGAFIEWASGYQWRTEGGSSPDRYLTLHDLPISAIPDVARRVEVERLLPAGPARVFIQDLSQDCLQAMEQSGVGAEVILERSPGIFPFPLGLDGTDQVIGHADSGLDSGADFFRRHPDLKTGILAGQSVNNKQEEVANKGWFDPTGHGTHTAGLIVGSGSASRGRFIGSAPGAKLVHHALSSSDGTLEITPDQFKEILEESMRQNAHIHSNSWGFERRDYAAMSEAIDRWSWSGGDPEELLIVFAAGNSGNGGDHGTLADPAAAKNALTIGSIDTDTGELAPSSSRGPTVDGRIKPDLVAPGTWLVSTRPRELHPLLVQDMEADGFRHWQMIGAQVWQTTREGSRDGAALTDSPSGDYGNGMDSILVSPPFSATAAREIEFWARWDVPEPSGHGLVLRFGLPPDQWLLSRKLPPRNPSWPEGDWFIEEVPEIFRLLGWSSLQVGFHLRTDESQTGDGLTLDDFRVSGQSGCSMISAGLDDGSEGLEDAYFVQSGTSMATALVSGVAARFRQFLISQLKGEEPSPILLKAAMIHGANRSSQPDYHRGWGEATLDLFSRPKVLLLDHQKVYADSEPHTFEIEVLEESPFLRATLAWWDPPAPRLVNDIDLVLTSPEGETFPETPDRHNNVEDLIIHEPTRGLWRVEVRPSKIEDTAAPFALVISGTVAEHARESLPKPPAGEHHLQSDATSAIAW